MEKNNIYIWIALVFVAFLAITIIIFTHPKSVEPPKATPPATTLYTHPVLVPCDNGKCA